MKPPKLSRAQLEVLRLLVKEPRSTSRSTALGYISGLTARALLRRKLARWVATSEWPFPRKVTITAAGRRALAAGSVS